MSGQNTSEHKQSGEYNPDDDVDFDYEEGDDQDQDQDQDDGGDDDDGDGTGDESNMASNNNNNDFSKFARASANGSEKTADAQPGNGKKRERSNAKAVECLDLEGNTIEVFRSGMAASMKLNIPQGDISLCCRGLKQSVMGFKFRFSGETEERQTQRLKKGFVIDYVGIDNTNKTEVTRTTRASRGEYGQGARCDVSSKSILDPPHLKSRNWKEEKVRVGPLIIRKWLPNVSEPTAALQERIPKNATEARLKLSKRRRTLNRLSIGSSMSHKATYEDVV